MKTCLAPPMFPAMSRRNDAIGKVPSMRAAFYERNGAARDVLRIGDVDTPAPNAGEVRVKLAASGVNPSDVKSRQGSSRKIAWPRVIPHSDGAGVIDQVGHGVSKARVGERVWVWNGQWKRAFGTAAEYIVVPDAQAIRLPENTTFAAGACLGIPAMTAYQAVALAPIEKSTTLLVSGGAGAVSQYVIQFAKMAGAQVITTISSEEKARVARAAGADHAINYKSENVGQRVMQLTGNQGVDAVIELDLAANAKLIPQVLRPKGSVIVYGTSGEATLPAFFCLTQSIRLQFFLVYELDADDRARAVYAITRALERNALKNEVAQATFSLADTAAAHEAVERGAIGNVVISI
jgi:NADPH2:quinone reductase